MWGSMTATWTKALGFLSLPEATRSLQATERKRGREGEREEETMERESREEKGRMKIRDEKGDIIHHDGHKSHNTGSQIDKM